MGWRKPLGGDGGPSGPSSSPSGPGSQAGPSQSGVPTTGPPAGTPGPYTGFTPDQIKNTDAYKGLTKNGVSDDIAQSIVKMTPPDLGGQPFKDPVMMIDGREMYASDPGFSEAVTKTNDAFTAEFGDAAQLIDPKTGALIPKPQALKKFADKYGGYVTMGIMAVKMAGLDRLAGGFAAMRDALMYMGPMGTIAAGALTVAPWIGLGLKKLKVGEGAQKLLGKMFEAFNLGGSSAAGTTVDSTMINPSEFNPAIMEELLLEVDQNPDFLGLGRPITREQIMNGEVAVPDSFLAELATGHEMTLDEARGDSERLGKGEGGIDVGYTRHNLATGGGTLSPDDLNRAAGTLRSAGITDPGQMRQVKSKLKTQQQLRAFQSNPQGWLLANGFTGAQGSLAA